MSEISKAKAIWEIIDMVSPEACYQHGDCDWNEIVTGIKIMKTKAEAFDTLMDLIYEEVKKRLIDGEPI